MPKNSKHKQAKRKQRQRAIRAGKASNKNKAIPFPHSNHAMSHEQKLEAKSAFWKVFSTLPVELQKQSIAEFEKGDNKISHLDVEGLRNLLSEGLNHFMRPHALADILEDLADDGQMSIPMDLEELITQLDDVVLQYVSNATYIFQCFEDVAHLDRDMQDKALYNNDKLNERLLPTLMMYQEAHDDIISPLVKYAEEFTNEIDEYVKQWGLDNDVDNLQEATRQIHLQRLQATVVKKQEQM